MSRYYVNKFLFMVDRDPELLARYAQEPHSFVSAWEQSIGPRLIGHEVEDSTVHYLTDNERKALVEHDFVSLFELGAHFFLNLTLFIGIYDEPYQKQSGPLAFQKEFAKRLSHWKGSKYPSIMT